MDNRTHFVVGSGQFINNDEALITWESFNVLTHLQNAGDAEETELHQWNEDGVIADFRFSLDTTKNVVINSLRLDLVISDGSNTIALDGVNVVLNPNIGDPPQIATNDIRNYILPPNSEFNLVKVDNDGSPSPKEFYRGIIGQKITWQEWIRNNNIPALFLNLSQLNNGLNQKADNYSGENGYNVYLKATAEVTGDDSIQGTVTRTYERLSSLINVYDYFESDDGVVVDGIIETFDASETTNLNGAILPDADTLFKVTWVGAAALDLADLGYIIHRIEPTFSPTNLQIEESSTVRGVVPTGKLTEILTAQEGDDIVSRCFIKGGSVTNGNWKLSARFKSPALPTAVSWILIHLTNPNGRNATFTARTKILANNKTFFAVNNATLQADYRFRIGNTDANLTDANDGGWTAFSEIDFATFIGQEIEANVKVRVSYVGTNTTDTDLLSAIRVGTDENEIATTTNTVFCSTETAANDILLPFQTQNNISLVISQFATNNYSNTRTDAEIAASSDLLDFNSGIGSLVNLNIDNYGHLLAENTTSNVIGQLSIESTANDASEGSVVGIVSPLQNSYYPITGNGVNPQALFFDRINDIGVLSSASIYFDFTSNANDTFFEFCFVYEESARVSPRGIRLFSNNNGLGAGATAFEVIVAEGANRPTVIEGLADSSNRHLMSAQSFLAVNGIYSVYIRLKKASNTGNTSTRFDLSQSFAVVNGRKTDFNVLNQGSTLSSSVVTTTEVGGASYEDRTAADAPEKYYLFAGNAGSATPILNEADIRAFMLGNTNVLTNMEAYYLLNTVSSNVVANQGVGAIVGDFTQTNGADITVNLF